MPVFNSIVIGLGRIGLTYDTEPNRIHPSTHAYAYHMSDDFLLKYAIDKVDSNKELLQSIEPECKFYSSINELLSKVSISEIDVVSVCTPPETHIGIVKNLIINNLGRVIFCEKPVVTDINEAYELKNLLKSNNICLIPNISRRWNSRLVGVSKDIKEERFGKLTSINVWYTRGIYNTGSHLFDLLKMWTGERIERVFATEEVDTSSYPEKSYSFVFEIESGVFGYATAVDDRNYYQFDIDLLFEHGKIEMRSSGDDLKFYSTGRHHLFDGFNELVIDNVYTGVLEDACMKNAIDNISGVLSGKEKPVCTVEDAIYPLYVAKALEESWNKKGFVKVIYE